MVTQGVPIGAACVQRVESSLGMRLRVRWGYRWGWLGMGRYRNRCCSHHVAPRRRQLLPPDRLPYLRRERLEATLAPFRAVVDRLITLPGVSQIVARVLVAEIGPVGRPRPLVRIIPPHHAVRHRLQQPRQEITCAVQRLGSLRSL